ncbi:putative multicopper oxidase protein [Penicillium brasilianum]|uniref:Putative multicopper oxidase protein n=1 Tax=Penicillium brasilianum TaxID=104259 RepID=A0A1S9R9L7_PENBI|nr:putative multicopper oxidase protein [Penicillium brasilianum]
MKAASLILGFLGVTTAASLHHQHLHPKLKRETCSGNTPSNRQKWCSYSTSTNYYDVVPNTGVTREYNFNIQEVTVAPDGYSRSAMAISGSIPGPKIQADWGDHAWEGVFGGIVINGPATENYDVDKGSLFLNDWSHQTVDELYDSAQSSGPPTLDNGLINGTNVYGDDNSTSQTGYRFNTSVTAGTSYRFRLVNAAIDTHFKFSIDNHTLTVMAMDFVPIEPFNTTVNDTTLSSTQTSPPAMTATGCGPFPSQHAPTTTEYAYTDSCDDMDMSDLVPYLPQSASLPYYNASEPVTLGENSENLFRWKMNGTSMQVEWDNPTLLQIWNNDTSFTNSSGVVELPRANEWAYVVIETSLSVPHPIHLHGHDFFVLAQGSGTYSKSSDLTSLTNPPRRDVAMLPSLGYLVVAFKTDNPGAWLMHYHIGWHTEEGFAIQFLERYEEARKLIDYSSLQSECKAWDEYVEESSVEQEDDGI